MKTGRKLGSIVCLAMVCCWIGLQQPTRADDEKKDGDEKRVTVQIEELKIGDVTVDEEVDEDGTTKRRMIAVRVRMHGGLDEKVESILKEAGLKGDKLEKACKQILEACKETCGGGLAAGTARQLFTLPKAKTPQAIVIGPDGKQQKIELKVTEVPAGPGLRQKIREQVEKALKEAGAKKEQLERVYKVLDQIDETQTRVLEWPVPHAVRVQAAKASAVGKYMIGLSCAPIDDALRDRLELDEGVGLVVQSVFDDTPAQKAGIQEGDALVKVGDQTIAKIEDLVEAVQEAGKAKKALTLTIQRDGKRRTIKVVPGESKAMEISVQAEIDDQALEGLKKEFRIDSDILGLTPGRIGELGPGVITKWGVFKSDDEEVKSLKKQVEELNRQVEELKKSIAKLKAEKD